MTTITARGTFNGHDLKDMPVLNPGAWFGKCWLLEIGGSYWPLHLVVEADSVSDAIDELADHEKYGFHIVVADDELGDYPEDERRYSATGKVLDLDHLLIHGQEGADCPFPCLYFGDDLPPEGMKPTDFARRDEVVTHDLGAVQFEQVTVKAADDGDEIHGVLHRVGVRCGLLLNGVGTIRGSGSSWHGKPSKK